MKYSMPFTLEHIKNIYFLGIGGIGMSALAHYFHLKEKTVVGYDRVESIVTKQLEEKGIKIFYTLDEKHIEGMDLVVYTPAISRDCVELQAADRLGIPVLKRSQVLGKISETYRTLAVAGTHGKTTTSTMLTHVLNQSGASCTAFLGGISNNLKSNFTYSESDLMVVEADEYDRSFMTLKPDIAVITSMDADHLDIYGTPEAMQENYLAFSAQAQRLVVHENLSQFFPKEKTQTFGMHQVATDWGLNKPEAQIVVDRRRAQEVALTPSQVADQAYYSITGALTEEYYRLPNQRQRTIQLRYDEPQRRDPQDLLLMMITTSDGKQIPLSTIADVKYRRSPNLINHDQMRRAITVMGFYRMNEPPSMDLAMEVMMKSMAKLNWPPGYGMEMRGDMTQMMDSFARLFVGLQLAVLFILLVLVAQFRGFLQPLQMIFSLPLELSGVFFALWLAHQTFSSVSIMAIIVVTGMDVTTAILLIDHILRYRQQGMPRDEAIARACPERLRPILMTTTITIIVMVPVAFFPKTGIDAYSPLGTVVIGGLIVGTVLSLFDIPIMHAYVDDLVNLFKRKKA